MIPMIGSAELEPHRRRIWALCYRMTGVGADADDLVQETFMRALEHPPADRARDLLPWLMRVAANASRDLLRRRKAQPYVGSWLPAPTDSARFAGEAASPDARYGQVESLSYAFLIALEALTPSQRAVLILRDVLGYSVNETAEALAFSEANVKTSHHRARAALVRYDREREQRVAASGAEAQAAVARFLAELSSGDAERVARVLAEDVVCVSDGGGEFLAALKPVVSRARVARFFVGVSKGLTVVAAQLGSCNGLPTLVVEVASERARVARRGVHLFEVGTGGEIARIYSVLATRKLAHLRGL